MIFCRAGSLVQRTVLSLKCALKFDRHAGMLIEQLKVVCHAQAGMLFEVLEVYAMCKPACCFTPLKWYAMHRRACQCVC